jgi:hypothetical protein
MMRYLPCFLLLGSLAGLIQIDRPWSVRRAEAQAVAKAITIEELRGAAITATIAWTGRVRWLKNNTELDGKDRWRWTVQIGPEGSISGDLLRHARTGRYATTVNYPHSAIVGKPDVRGRRADLWTFNANTLTVLTTYKVGGTIAKFVFVRCKSGLACSFHHSYLRESGAGQAMALNPFGVSDIQIVTIKQTSSTCRVRKD